MILISRSAVSWLKNRPFLRLKPTVLDAENGGFTTNCVSNDYKDIFSVSAQSIDIPIILQFWVNESQFKSMKIKRVTPERISLFIFW